MGSSYSFFLQIGLPFTLGAVLVFSTLGADPGIFPPQDSEHNKGAIDRYYSLSSGGSGESGRAAVTWWKKNFFPQLYLLVGLSTFSTRQSVLFLASVAKNVTHSLLKYTIQFLPRELIP